MSMRHIRDPITGAKVGIGANQSPDRIARPRPTFKDAATKIVYVNTGLPPPPPPAPPAPPALAPLAAAPPSPRRAEKPSGGPSPSLGSETPTSLSHVYYGPRTPSPPPGQKNVVYVNHDSGTPRWPPTRGRSPSPRRSVAPEYNNRSQPKPFGHNSRFVNNKNGSAYHVGQTYQGAQWGQRRCYTLLWGILLILLLAALIAGLYFLIKYAQRQAALRSPDVLYPGGYYENGLYILPSTIATGVSYGIIERPCNPFNNNTEPSVLYPNCSGLTTRIVNLTTTTLDPLLVTAASGSRPDYRLLVVVLATALTLYILSLSSQSQA